MANIVVGIGGSRDITDPGSDSVSFIAGGTLNVVGTPQTPIDVTLSNVVTVGVATTLNISYANVKLAGLTGVSAATTYNIGNGGTLEIQNGVGVAVGSTVNFTGATGHFIVDSFANVPLLSSFSGFGPGKTIDIASVDVARVAYSDGTGIGTGGMLTLYNAANASIGTIALTTGEFVASNFALLADGGGGTILSFSSVATGLTTTLGTATIGLGATVGFTVSISNPISVAGGTPSLLLNNGGVATFDAANSSSTQLKFTYTVGANQNTTDLTVTGVALNGATLATIGGGGVDLSGFVGNPAGILTIDSVVPTIGLVTTSTPNAILGVGGTVAVNVAVSKTVNVSGGPPSLTLSDGGVATFDAASSTGTNLVFRHTVLAGQNTADLAVTALNINGASVADLAGNLLNLAAVVTNPAGTLVVDTTAPTIASVTTSPGSGSLSAGQVVTFNVATNEAVLLTGGTPTLTLSDGGLATFDAASSTGTNLVFRHTVLAGQNTADLAVTALNINGASVADLAGNLLNLAAVVTNPAGTLVVDTIAPTIVSVTTSPGSGTVVVGQTVTFNVATNEAVLLTGGTPTLTLSDGGLATFDAASSTATNLVFRHTVQVGQNTADLAVTALNINGASVADLAGNLLNLAAVVTNPAGTLVVDSTLPAVASITTNPSSATLSAGQTVSFDLTLTQGVVVTSGAPSLRLDGGGIATYDTVNSTPTHLIFQYTVQAGENSTDLAVIGVDLNGSSFHDLGGHALNFDGAITNPAGILVIDTTAPTIASVTTSPGNGALSAGQVVTFNVATSEAVLLAGGTPTLTLNDGGVATFDSSSSTGTNLVFRHTVLAGQTAADLEIIGIALNGATLADLAGNALALSGAVTNPSGILRVDTNAPVVTGVTTNPGTGLLNAGQSVSFAITLSEAVALTGGTPTLTLSDGGTAIYDAANSTPTLLVFTHVVQAGQNTADLAITGATIAGALGDAAGNLLDLTAAIGNPAGVLVVRTAPPTSIVTVATTPGDGTVTPGQTVRFTVTTDHPVSVINGTPVLTLSDGGFATYDPVNSTPTSLVFSTVIQPGQLAADLAIVGYDLHGASIVDANGATVSLDAARVNPAGVLNVTNGVTPPTSGSSTPVAPMEVYRFFDTVNGTHFYTTNNAERMTILQNRPDLAFEGVGLRAVDPASGDVNAIEVFRFFDTVHGTQFLTASTSERDDIIATRPDLKFEPQGSFFEHTQPQPNDTPVYRFFSQIDGTHFYTDNAAERASVIQTRPDLISEGIGFYEPS